MVHGIMGCSPVYCRVGVRVAGTAAMLLLCPSPSQLALSLTLFLSVSHKAEIRLWRQDVVKQALVRHKNSRSLSGCDLTWPQNKDFLQCYWRRWKESMTVSHQSLPRPQALASRRGVFVWVTFVTEMTRLIKGWPFAAGMPQSLRPAVPACLSDLGLAS